MKRSGISVLIIINVLMIIEITQKHQRVLTVMVRKRKKKSRIIVKIIRDSYGNVTRVFVEPKAKKKKEVVDMAAAAYQSLLAME